MKARLDLYNICFYVKNLGNNNSGRYGLSSIGDSRLRNYLCKVGVISGDKGQNLLQTSSIDGGFGEYFTEDHNVIPAYNGLEMSNYSSNILNDG